MKTSLENLTPQNSFSIKQSIGVVIPTLNSAHHLDKCIPPLRDSPLKPRILVIDSSSDDNTLEKARSLGAETAIIPRSEFNHGLTREKARALLGTDIVVMVTADAYAESIDTLEKLVDPILRGETSFAYARQLPHHGAGFFEAFPRLFNYPETSHIRSLADTSTYGVYTFFCSDSCAAYLNKALDEVGGFPYLLLGEDTVATAKLLRKGHKIAYVAEARVRHSHRYSLKQEFQRYFDTGIARKDYEELIACEEGDNKRGSSFFRKLCFELTKSKPWLLPYAVLQTTAKFAGYHIGRKSLKAPLWFKKLCSSQKYFWK